MGTKQTHLDHAIYMYKQAVHIDPEYAEAFYNLGVAYEYKYKDKSTELSEKMYERAIEINKDKFIFARASLNLARIYREQGKYDEAIALIRDAVKKEPDFPKLYNEAGRNYFAADLNDMAIKYYEKALELQERFPEAATNLAVALMKGGKLVKAMDLLEKTIRKDPAFAGAHYNYGNALLVKTFYEKAEKHYNFAIKFHREQVRRELVYDLKRNVVTDFFARAFSMDLPKDIPVEMEFYQAYHGLGKALLYQNKFEEAAEAFNKSLKAKKDYAPAVASMEELKKLEESFRDHIAFKKKKGEDDEGDEGDEGEEEEQEEAEVEEGEEETKDAWEKRIKYKDWEENVEDLRLEEEKKKGEDEEDLD